MKQLLIILCILAAIPIARSAEEPGTLRKMKPPKGVTLTPEEEKMLEEANRALEAGHKLLIESHDPAAAVEQLRRALAIANQLKLLKPEQLMTGSLSGRGTPEDKIETEGGMERIIEIAANMAVEAPAEVDNGLHKRKVAKLAADESRKLAQQQKQLTEQIAQAQQQQPQGQPQQQEQQGGAEKQRNKGVQQNILIQQSSTASQAQPENQQSQNQPDQKQTADPAQQQNGAQASKDQQPNQENKQTAAAQQNQQNKNGQQNQGKEQPGQQTANAEQNQDQNQVPQNGGGQAGPDQLARNQENIARALHRIATALTPSNQGDPAESRASQAFRRAGDEAARTAELLRNNQLDSAAANSRQVERAIGEALTAAGANAGQRQAEAIAALQRQLDAAQSAQQKILGQTQQIQRNADGTAASEELQKDRARTLAIEQGKLKPQLESVQRTLAELGESGDGGKPNSAQNAAREELNNAAAELQKGRAKQALVNAAMRLANGEPASAATAMMQTQAALKAAQRRLEAAAGALAGNSAAMQQEYGQVQQAAAALRRLQRDARGAGAQPANSNAQPPDPKSANTQPNANDKPNPNAATQPPHANQDNDGVAVSATWGGMLNRSAQQINAELQKLAPALAAINPDAAKEISALAAKSTAFERDREGSLAQVASLLKEVEKIELALAKKIAGDEERKALNSYRKDDIPQPYRKAVAAYYEELSKDK